MRSSHRDKAASPRSRPYGVSALSRYHVVSPHEAYCEGTSGGNFSSSVSENDVAQWIDSRPVAPLRGTPPVPPIARAAAEQAKLGEENFHSPKPRILGCRAVGCDSRILSHLARPAARAGSGPSTLRSLTSSS